SDLAVSRFSSVLTLTTFSFSACSSPIWSTIGLTMRQGPHQGAQKSTSTGLSDFNTVSSNVASVTSVDMGNLLSERISLAGTVGQGVSFPAASGRMVLQDAAAATSAAAGFAADSRS